MHMRAVGGLIGDAMVVRPDGVVRSWTRTGPGPLVRLRRDRAYTRMRLYCLPYAGGCAGVFRSWCDLLPADIDVWGGEYPGPGSRISECSPGRIRALPCLTRLRLVAESSVP